MILLAGSDSSFKPFVNPTPFSETGYQEQGLA